MTGYRQKCLGTKTRLLALFLLSMVATISLSTLLSIWPGLELSFYLLAAPSSVSCNRTLGFSPVVLPVTALASIQGSGNTWLRHLLQQMTGIYTGSIYGRRNDPELWKEGYYGEGVRNGSVIAIKTHGLPDKRYRYQRAIVVIRNPFNAMFAEFNRQASRSHTGIAPARAYIKNWDSFSRPYIDRWTKFYDGWMKFSGPLLLLNYDDLLESLDSQVEKLAEFVIHSSLTMNTRCTLSAPRGSFKRKRYTFDKLEVFSDQQIQHINENIETVQNILKRRFPKISEAMSEWRRNVPV